MGKWSLLCVLLHLLALQLFTTAAAFCVSFSPPHSTEMLCYARTDRGGVGITAALKTCRGIHIRQSAPKRARAAVGVAALQNSGSERVDKQKIAVVGPGDELLVRLYVVVRNSFRSAGLHV